MTLAHFPLICAVFSSSTPNAQEPALNERLRSGLTQGVDAQTFARLDAMAVVRVTSHELRQPARMPGTDSWQVEVLSKPDGSGAMTELVKPGAGPFGPALEPGRTYLVLATLPSEGFEIDLFDTGYIGNAREAGQAWPRWALPFSGSPPRSGGTKEEWYGRALLATLEGDPAVYKKGLEEFFESTDPEVLGLSEEAVPPDLFQWLFAGRIPNAFALGLADWARRHGPAERLFAACALRNLQVSGVMPLEHQARWEYAALDRDPPEGILYSTTDEIAETYELDLSPELRARMLGRWPTPEQWLSRLLSLKNPKARMFLLRSGLEGRLSHDQNRRLAALLDSPDPEMRYILCRHFWLSQLPIDRPLEPKRRSEGLHNSLPDDYPRLDEHVARWQAFYR